MVVNVPLWRGSSERTRRRYRVLFHLQGTYNKSLAAVVPKIVRKAMNGYMWWLVTLWKATSDDIKRDKSPNISKIQALYKTILPYEPLLFLSIKKNKSFESNKMCFAQNTKITFKSLKKNTKIFAMILTYAFCLPR